MPVIFTIFANPKGDLQGLSQEQNGIQDALDPLVGVACNVPAFSAYFAEIIFKCGE